MNPTWHRAEPLDDDTIIDTTVELRVNPQHPDMVEMPRATFERFMGEAGYHECSDPAVCDVAP